MSTLDLPLYAGKPQRKVPGTDVTAVTMRASADRSIRQYVLFDADGNRLGDVAAHGARRGFIRAGSHLGHGVYEPSRGDVHFDSLAEVAQHLTAARSAP